MAENSKISWTDHTVNFWMGCTAVSKACDSCYAENMMDKRYGRVTWGPHGERVRTSDENWKKPYRWNKTRHPSGRRWRVFTLSLGDFFDNQAPEEWRRDAWRVIRDTQNLEWLILTKRPQNIVKMLPDDWGYGYDNVRLGVTAENQIEADRRIPVVLSVPAKLRPFISVEPMLSYVSLRQSTIDATDGKYYPYSIGQIIVGCESGTKARATDEQWFINMRNQCDFWAIPFFVKQMMVNGKLQTEPELDGRQWLEFPTDSQKAAA